MGLSVSDGAVRPSGRLLRCDSAGEGLRARRLRIDGNWLVVGLEDELWEVFDEIADLEGQSADDMAELVEAARSEGVTLAAAMRGFIARYLMSRRLRA